MQSALSRSWKVSSILQSRVGCQLLSVENTYFPWNENNPINLLQLIKSLWSLPYKIFIIINNMVFSLSCGDISDWNIKKTGFSRSWDSHRPSLYNGSSMRTLIILFDPTIDEWAVWMKGKLKQIPVSPGNLFVEMRIFFSSLSPIWGELSWEEHFILTCRMHSRAGSPFVKWTQDARGNWAKHRAGRSLSAAASWSSFRNNSKSFFRFQFPKKIISYSCNYFAREWNAPSSRKVIYSESCDRPWNGSSVFLISFSLR